MKTYDFVHLVLYAAGGKIEGRTKLQKIVYFAGVLTEQEDELGYRAHFYGPYSPDVAGAVDKLRSLGFLRQSAAGIGTLDQRGFEVARFDYELTADGNLIAEDKSKEYSRSWKHIKAAVNRLVRSDPNDYVKLSIAAKTYFLHDKAKGKASSQELKRLGIHFGWKVTNEEVSEAVEWLKVVRLVEHK